MDKTTIVVPAFDQNILQRRITSACLGNITRYTNRDEYELILVDQGKLLDLNNRFHKIDIDKWIKLKENLGSSGAMNRGAKEADPNTKYICFLHTDVFVSEGWLEILRSVLKDGGYKIVMPHQGADDREFVKKSRDSDTPMIRGDDDAGLVMMYKESFAKTGGWDERFKGVFMEKAFRMRFQDPVYVTAKCIITHLCGITFYGFDKAGQDSFYKEEAAVMNYPSEMDKKINYLL